MKRLVLLITLFVLTTNAIAQEHKWSIEANYPLAIDDGFLGAYDGILDLGLKYRITELGIVRLGASVNSSLFLNKSSRFDNSSDFRITTYILQPNAFAEFVIDPLNKLHPSIGVGYSIVHRRFNGESAGTGLSQNNGTDGGLNVKIGAAYDISDRFIVQLHYDYTRLNVRDNDLIINYNENIGMVRVGIGVRF